VRTERFGLDNGLTVIVRESRGAPVVSMAVRVGVGSADESDAERGLTHVLEHMLFKGTARRGVGEIAATVEGCGGSINAYTSMDETVYHLTMSSRFTDVGLDVLGDVLSHPLFDADELARELEVIAEELRRSSDQPHALAAEALFELAFTEHPYRLPVGGTEASVAALRRPDVVEFFGRWYVASNMTLVVVGDTSLAEVRPLVEAAFGELGAGPMPPRVRASEPPQRASRVSVRPTDDAEVLVRIAFQVGGLRAPDGPALDALSVLLGGGEASRLVHGLEYELGWVNDVGASTFRGVDIGLFGVTADLQVGEGHPGVLAVLEAVLAHLAAIGQEAPAEQELLRVRTLLLSREIYQRQSVEGQAMALGAFEAALGGWEMEALYDQRLAGLRADDLRRAAASALRSGGASVLLYGARAALEGVEASAVEALLEAQLGGRGPAGFLPGVELDSRGMARVELPGGPRLVVQHVDGVESVSLRLVGFGGVEAEPRRLLGLSNLLARLWTRGTAHHNGPELAAKMEGLAGALYGVSGKSTMGLRLDVLTRNLPESLALLQECLSSPTFVAEELDRERRLVLEGIRARRDDVGSVAHIVLHAALYGDHPYGVEASGLRSTVEAIGQADLQAYYVEQVRPSGMVLSVVGDMDVDALVEWASTALTDPAEAAARDRLGGRVPVPPLGGPVYLTTSMEREQVWLGLGLRTGPVNGPDRFVLEVLAAVLSGQGGRLFVELRDRRSLAYAVHAYTQAGLDAGEFVLAMATSPSKVEASVEALLGQLEALATGAIGEGELLRAQRYLVGHNDIALQRMGSRSTRFCLDELYGLGHDATWRYAGRIMAVSLEDLRQVARELFNLENAALAMVHPPSLTPPSFAHLGFGASRSWVGGD